MSKKLIVALRKELSKINADAKRIQQELDEDHAVLSSML